MSGRKHVDRKALRKHKKLNEYKIRIRTMTDEESFTSRKEKFSFVILFIKKFFLDIHSSFQSTLILLIFLRMKIMQEISC